MTVHDLTALWTLDVLTNWRADPKRNFQTVEPRATRLCSPVILQGLQTPPHPV